MANGHYEPPKQSTFGQIFDSLFLLTLVGLILFGPSGNKRINACVFKALRALERFEFAIEFLLVVGHILIIPSRTCRRGGA